MNKIQNFPIMLFTTIMGLGELSMDIFRNSVKAELHHPIKINFFPAFSISLLLLAALFSEFSGVSKALFYAGVASQSIITLYVISAWISRDINIEHSNPAWFIPVAANLLIPALVPFDAPWTWFYFSFALFFLCGDFYLAFL